MKYDVKNISEYRINKKKIKEIKCSLKNSYINSNVLL